MQRLYNAKKGECIQQKASSALKNMQEKNPCISEKYKKEVRDIGEKSRELRYTNIKNASSLK